MGRVISNPFARPYSYQAADLLRNQQIELETTAQSIREDPHLHNLSENDAHQVADVYEAAGLVFRQALIKAPQS